MGPWSQHPSAPAEVLVEIGKTVHHRRPGLDLQGRIERGPDRKAALVGGVLAVHGDQLAADVLRAAGIHTAEDVLTLPEEIVSGHPDRQVAVWLEGLSHATDLMIHTVSQLMNTSVGVETSLRLEDVDLPRLVERACAYYRRAADAKGIDVKFHAAADVPTVETDRVLLAAVLDNLLSNAVKYSPRDKRIWVDVEPERDGVACRVRDEGPGLSPAEQERLFLPGVTQLAD